MSCNAIRLAFSGMPVVCACFTTGYLKDNNYTATGQAFSEECPYLSSDDEARPSESLEEIVRNYRRQKQFSELQYMCTK